MVVGVEELCSAKKLFFLLEKRRECESIPSSLCKDKTSLGAALLSFQSYVGEPEVSVAYSFIKPELFGCLLAKYTKRCSKLGFWVCFVPIFKTYS